MRMNRIIKFRAWDKKNKVWLEDDDWYIEADGTVMVSDNDRPPSYSTAESYGWDVELMQFTGLLDKNGKEIYEGDIINHESENYEVHWSDLFGQWFGCNELYNDIKVATEVIGNIYENPELLK